MLLLARLRSGAMLLLLSSVGLTACSSDTTDQSTTEVGSEEESQDGYADGTYCATVEYYLSRTGTSSTYTLPVDIEDNQLVKIHWPNGGWLDETHYSGPDISDGYASFTSDVGADYTVRIIGDECSGDTDATGEDEDISRYEDEQQRAETEQQEEEQRLREEEQESSSE